MVFSLFLTTFALNRVALIEYLGICVENLVFDYFEE